MRQIDEFAQEGGETYLLQVSAEHVALCEDISIGDVSIDLRQRVVMVGSKPEKFTRREFDMLCYLAIHPG